MREAKKVLRRELLARRAGLDEKYKKEVDAAIAERLSSLPEWQSAELILLYCSYGDEVDTGELARRAISEGKCIAYPRCELGEEKTMDFYECSREELIEGYKNIPEPPSRAPRVQACKNTLCIVPALAFDKEKNRLGYGGGFYDRYLAGFDGITVGLCRGEFLFDELPREVHDLPIKIIITEGEIIK